MWITPREHRFSRALDKFWSIIGGMKTFSENPLSKWASSNCLYLMHTLSLFKPKQIKSFEYKKDDWLATKWIDCTLSNFSVLWLLLVGRWKYRCAYRAHALQANRLNWKVFASINISENQSFNNMHETWTIQSFQNRRISTIIFELSSQFWIESNGELTFQPFFCTMGTWYCRYLSTKMTLVLKI